MKKLNQILEKTSVFVLEIEGDEKEKERLYSLGVLPERIITVVKNEKNQSSIVVEIDESRFLISKEISKNIIVNHILNEEDFIFNSNYKKTTQRSFILNELKNQKGHFSLNEFTSKLKKKDSKIGTVTVYRTLKLLVEKGILEILELPDETKRFEIKKGHHDHIICENCGSIIEFRNEKMEKIQEEIAKEYDVKLNSHKVNLFVKSCPNCKN